MGLDIDIYEINHTGNPDEILFKRKATYHTEEIADSIMYTGMSNWYASSECGFLCEIDGYDLNEITNTSDYAIGEFYRVEISY